MGIRTLLSRSASGVALPSVTPGSPVPVFSAAASTVRVPTGLCAALRQATAHLRPHLAQGWRPAGPTRAAAGSVGGDPTGAAARRSVTDLPAVPYLTVRASTAPRPGTAGAPGRTPRPWAELARGYLALVLALLPRPGPAHTTITVFIATTDDLLSERPDGSAPSRRHGRHRQGPEPDATP